MPLAALSVHPLPFHSTLYPISQSTPPPPLLLCRCMGLEHERDGLTARLSTAAAEANRTEAARSQLSARVTSLEAAREEVLQHNLNLQVGVGSLCGVGGHWAAHAVCWEEACVKRSCSTTITCGCGRAVHAVRWEHACVIPGLFSGAFLRVLKYRFACYGESVATA